MTCPPPADPTPLLTALRAEALQYQRAAYAPGTLAAANTALRAYAAFCYVTGRWPDPNKGTSDDDLILYVAFLARTLSIATIDNYISMGVARFHREMGMPWTPLHQRFQVQSTIRGVQRLKGSTAPTNRKAPVTPEMLRKLRQIYNLQSLHGMAHFAATLTMFYGLLRKSNVLRGRNTDRHLITRADVRKNADDSFTILLRTSKTQQVAGQQTIPIVLARESTSDVCPATYLDAYMAATAHRPPTDQLFGYYARTASGGTTWRGLTYDEFLPNFKAALTRAGYTGTAFGAHSLRRGGATHAFFLGIPDHLIMLLGGWKSPVWHDYVEVQEELRKRAAASLASGTTYSPSSST